MPKTIAFLVKWLMCVCYSADFVRTVQAMECLGLIGFVLSLVTLILYCTLDSARRRDYMQAAAVFCFAGSESLSDKKNPGFVTFGSNLTQFGAHADTPALRAAIL